MLGSQVGVVKEGITRYDRGWRVADSWNSWSNFFTFARKSSSLFSLGYVKNAGLHNRSGFRELISLVFGAEQWTRGSIITTLCAFVRASIESVSATTTAANNEVLSFQLVVQQELVFVLMRLSFEAVEISVSLLAHGAHHSIHRRRWRGCHM